MKYFAHIFSDPTGAGEDAVIIAPEWAEVGGILMLRDADGNPLEFQGVTDPPEEVDEDVAESLVNGENGL